MIPQTEEDYQMEIVDIPSKTYGLDLAHGTLSGFVDNEAALKQAILKILLTEAQTYLPYGLDYGILLNDLYGANTLYAQSEVQSRIRDAILNDDRFVSVTFTSYTHEKKTITVSFIVTTTDGTEIEMEGVNLDV